MLVLLFENMLLKSNAYRNIRIIASFFLNREYISYSGQYIFRKYWNEYYTLCKDVIVEKKVACANFDDRNSNSNVNLRKKSNKLS